MIPLPIDPLLPELVAALRRHPNAVVVAPPGSGKTTRVPPALLDAGLAGAGKVVVLQPRRVAARLSARRIALERGTPLGGEVGYTVRFERKTSAATRLEVVTEGLLVRRLQQDPFLSDVGVVVLDEFHERSLDVDLALALLVEAQRAGREDLRLVVMSATLDPGPVAAFLGDAPVLQAEGRAWPVDLVYDARPDDRPVIPRAADAVRGLLSRAPDGHVLVFLPGAGEIRGLMEALGDVDAAVLPLYSGLSAEDQDRALAPSAHRKVVLATNIAETSVTLEGVVAVVDTGLHRAPRYDPATGLDRLELQRISAASADQRAGRAGRTAPGRCRRLWTLAEQQRLAPADPPEVLRADLTRAALELRAWGVDPASFSWFEAPPPGALASADRLLRALGALGADGAITPRGQQLLTLPIHPRLAAVVVAGHDAGCLPEAAAAAALASERDPWERSEGAMMDLEARVEALDGPAGDGDRRAIRAVREVRDQLIGLAEGALGRAGRGRGQDGLVRALLAGFPDRVALRRAPGSERVKLAGGSGAILERRGDPGTDLLLAVVMDAGRTGERAEHRIRLAAALDRRWLGALREEVELGWDPEREAVVARRGLRYGALLLDERALAVPPDPDAASRLLASVAAARPPSTLGLDEEAQRIRDRVRFLRGARPDLDLPDLDNLDSMLLDLCVGMRSLADLRRLDWAEALLGRLSYAQRQALDTHAPDRLPVPSGVTVRVDYSSSPPVLAARIQQLFGMTQTPRLGGQPVLVHLLAPNHRPMQVTQDLASFWSVTYAEVRRDLRGRYPRHAWPEDPLQAIPENRPQRR